MSFLRNAFHHEGLKWPTFLENAMFVVNASNFFCLNCINGFIDLDFSFSL